jgi:L-aminopeptidase/D-esterase-like protein
MVGPVGVRVGHWTDREARTGCTVVLFDRAVQAAVETRGGAPGTRETDLLAAGKLVRRVDAILLTGGSVFGLAAADGVVRYLSEQGRGFPTSAGPVPIVSAAVIYDLAVGRPLAPDASSGYAACVDAREASEAARGAIGAGAGATVGKASRGVEEGRGGFGIGRCGCPEGDVTAFVVVNAFGDVVDPSTGHLVSNSRTSVRDRREEIIRCADAQTALGENTTLAVVVVAAPCDHDGLIRCTVAAHDGLARAIRPCHTIFDGDVVFAATVQDGAPTPEQVLRLTVAAEMAVERAVVDAVAA